MSVAISPDGRLTAGSSGVYESDTGRLVHHYDEQLGPIGGVSFSGDGRRLAMVGAYRINMLDTQNWALLGQHNTGDEPAVSFAPDGKLLVTGGISGEVTLWQAEPLRRIAVMGRHTARVKQVTFSHDGSRIASVG